MQCCQYFGVVLELGQRATVHWNGLIITRLKEDRRMLCNICIPGLKLQLIELIKPHKICSNKSSSCLWRPRGSDVWHVWWCGGNITISWWYSILTHWHGLNSAPTSATTYFYSIRPLSLLSLHITINDTRGLFISLYFLEVEQVNYRKCQMSNTGPENFTKTSHSNI